MHICYVLFLNSSQIWVFLNQNIHFQSFAANNLCETYLSCAQFINKNEFHQFLFMRHWKFYSYKQSVKCIIFVGMSLISYRNIRFNKLSWTLKNGFFVFDERRDVCCKESVGVVCKLFSFLVAFALGIQ